jgi:hypothetical protein
MSQLFQRVVEAARSPIGIRKEGTDVHLIDPQLVVGRQLKCIVLPVETCRIVDDPVPRGIRDLSCVGVDALQLQVAVEDHKFIFLAGLGRWHVRVPVAILFMRERRRRIRPVVEVTFDKDRSCVWRPDAKGYPSPVDDRPHPLLNFRLVS